MNAARRGPPVPRSRSGVYGRRHERTGSEPATAQSAVRLRLLLSALFTPLCLAAAAGFALWAAASGGGSSPGSGPLWGIALACGLLGLLGAVDLGVLVARLRRERGGPR
ncbi:DUF6343 family protein [Streptomyces boncukensis]|uniref:Uncharacterized protein n=1 Tax=Streptomyces boncukensis TaxID=2711219 RepID=A0A6G4X6G9_9ACTN|nr:DUF6343 family protein [Streptomyces boncukensis]NGO72732.1 hypothetical protein [Streptomyces boncukensis]